MGASTHADLYCVQGTACGGFVCICAHVSLSPVMECGVWELVCIDTVDHMVIILCGLGCCMEVSRGWSVCIHSNCVTDTPHG